VPKLIDPRGRGVRKPKPNPKPKPKPDPKPEPQEVAPEAVAPEVKE